MTREVFPVIRYQARKRGKCPRCGKLHMRTKRFEHTINPFNVHADGTPKTQLDVYRDVLAEAKAWEQKPIEPCVPRCVPRAGEGCDV